MMQEKIIEKKRGRFRRVSKARIFDGHAVKANAYAVTVMVLAYLFGLLDPASRRVVRLFYSAYGTYSWAFERVFVSSNGKTPDSFYAVFRSYHWLPCSFFHYSELSAWVCNGKVLGHVRYGWALQPLLR
jgi:hypothetical protein